MSYAHVVVVIITRSSESTSMALGLYNMVARDVALE